MTNSTVGLKGKLKSILIFFGIKPQRVRKFFESPYRFFFPYPSPVLSSPGLSLDAGFLGAKNTVKKLKVALCFSGQIRQLDKGYEYINKNILEPNKDDCEIDIFIHSWFKHEEIGSSYKSAAGTPITSTISPTVLMDIYKYYNPQKMLSEKQIIFDEKNYRDRKPEKIVPMFSLSKNYSLKQSFALKKQHEVENKFTYDFVMSLRFDLGIGNVIRFKDLNPDVVTISEAGVAEDGGVDVTHAVVGGGLSDIYGTFYDHMGEYYNEGIRFCDEVLMHRHFDVNNIKFIRTPLMNNYILLR